MELEAVFDSFADATETTLARMADEIRALRAELQTRGAPVQGERGLQGERGEPGLHGRDGVDGKDGRDGVNGERGERGERGADGLNGRDGDAGPRGERGERGADGIATIEELDARIEARFAELQVRTFADLYQGVFEPAKTYARGSLATWGGSLWLAMGNTQSRPGETADWKLVVKRGADGRK